MKKSGKRKMIDSYDEDTKFMKKSGKIKMADSESKAKDSYDEDRKFQKKSGKERITDSEEEDTKSMKKSGKRRMTDSESEAEDSESEDMKFMKKSRKRKMTDSEEEDMKSNKKSEKRKMADSESEDMKSMKKSGKRRMTDSESEAEDSESEDMKFMKKSGKRKMTDSDEEDTKSMKKSQKRRMTDSDEEDMNFMKKSRKRRRIDSVYENRKLSDTDSNSNSDEIISRKKTSKRTKRKENKTNEIEENYFIGIEEEKNYENIKTIAESETSIVYKLIDKTTLKPICKKVMKVEGTTFNDFRNALKEFQILYYLKHPCICTAIGLNTSDIVKKKTDQEREITTVSLYLEFIDYTLKDIITNSIINNSLKTQFIIEIIHGMKYLHSKGMIYRDLNTESIMINATFHVKLIDFGLAKINEQLFGEESMTSYSLTKGIGKDEFMSPEMMMQEDYDNKTDVYSFGIIMYYIFVGRIPKQNITEKSNGKKNQIT